MGCGVGKNFTCVDGCDDFGSLWKISLLGTAVSALGLVAGWAHEHTRAHAHTRTRAHARTHTNTHVRAHTHTRAHANAQTHTCVAEGHGRAGLAICHCVVMLRSC